MTARMLSASQKHILLAIARGYRLKDHRDIEGNKVFILHAPDESGEPVAREDVETLVDLGLISSNKKFPSATYWLTPAGQALAQQIAID
ncbi:MAG: hypothetical protein N2545_04935 [Thermoflexales bacterium]|nr:hypothetical protein [Thermoflexales bacterium]